NVLRVRGSVDRRLQCGDPGGSEDPTSQKSPRRQRPQTLRRPVQPPADTIDVTAESACGPAGTGEGALNGAAVPDHLDNQFPRHYASARYFASNSSAAPNRSDGLKRPTSPGPTPGRMWPIS